MLDAVAVRLHAPEKRELRRGCDWEALARDPQLFGPRWRLASDAIASIQANTCVRLPDCENEVIGHAKALERARPDVSEGARLRARMHLARGDPAAAERTLAEVCKRVRDRATCLQARLEAALQMRPHVYVGPVAKELLGAECVDRLACAASATRLGDSFAGLGEWNLATTFYLRAVREEPSEARYEKVADAASRAGAHGRAVEALERLKQLRGGGDEGLRRRIADERARALGGAP